MATRREELRKEYLKDGWRDKAPKDSPAGRNRDAEKKKAGKKH